MAFPSPILAAALVLTGTSWCQTIRTAPIRIRTVPGSILAAPVSPISGPSFQNQLSLSLAAPAGSIIPVSIALLSLPAPEIKDSVVPSLSAAVPVLTPAGPSQTSAERKAATSLESRILQLSETIAAPLKTAGDDKASPDGSRRAGQEIEKALIGETLAEAQEDLPPAGPVTDLDSKQVSWMEAEFVTGAHPILTSQGFQAFILWDAKAMEEVLPWLRNERQAMALTLNAMIGSLRRVAESDLPAMERGRLAQALNERLKGTVKALSENPYLKPMRTLDGKVQSLLAPSPAQTGAPTGQAQEKVEHPWQIKPPLPKESRGQDRDTEVSLVNKTADWAAMVKEWRFLVEKHLSRYQIAARSAKFSRRIEGYSLSAKEFTAQKLIAVLEDYKRKAGVLFTGVERIASYSLVNGFLNPESITGRARGIVWVPDNKGLRLSAEKGGWVVKASFETDIQDDAVLRSVKASIEEYWQGSFEFQKKTHTFRTEIEIRKLAPGTAFSQGALAIRDNDKWLSLAGPDVILLGHDLQYATAAHEFGHTMGLADEYRNGYDPDLRASVEFQNPASIMSSLAGSVLPRHLRLAFLLLKRRSMAPSGSGGRLPFGDLAPLRQAP
ncbi:MAG: hypothetical protein HZB91_08220 [Elusimicrobia bacterium]|nr:hypothetical protein [Elusimicrobiota bacterium]